MTWEQAVLWLRGQPEYAQLVRDCYYDAPLLDAARRFYGSSEWGATRRLLGAMPGRVLDMGAGMGIASFALASDGWTVTALEPDPGSVVGAGAIRELAASAGLAVAVVEEHAESMPIPDLTFDLVYCREVLHHAAHMAAMCCEALRVLKPGGVMVAVREPVISRREDLPEFLSTHPLHRLYGGEHACVLEEYLDAIRAAGFKVRCALKPLDSVINYFPMTEQDWRGECARPLVPVLGWRLAMALADPRHALGRRLLRWLSERRARSEDCAGLYSFVAEKVR